MKLRREIVRVEEEIIHNCVIDTEDHCMNSINNTSEPRAGKSPDQRKQGRITD